MNIKLIKEKWKKYYKRGFLTGLFVLSFICIIDQVLQSPFFFNKIDLFALSFILFGSVFCGMLSLVILVILSLVTVHNN